MNRCIQTGRFTADPELRHTDTGTPVVSFVLAVDRRFKDANGNKITDFFDYVAWKNTAEFIAEYFTKGKKILVESTPQVREWTNKNGERRRNVEFVVESVEFCDSPNGNRAEKYDDVDASEDLPF
jgi:single stranded DNA-binding protein (ssb)